MAGERIVGSTPARGGERIHRKRRRRRLTRSAAALGAATAATMAAALLCRSGGRMVVATAAAGGASVIGAVSGGRRRRDAFAIGVCERATTAARDRHFAIGGGRRWPLAVANRPLRYLDERSPVIPLPDGVFRGLHTAPARDSPASGGVDDIIPDGSEEEEAAAENSAGPAAACWEWALDLPEGHCVGLRLLDTTVATDGDAVTAIGVEEASASLTADAVASNPDHWIRRCLHPDEVEMGLSLTSDATRESFFVGRMAMRMALLSEEAEQANVDEQLRERLPQVEKSEHAILRDEHSRPTVPPGYLGSISHKRSTGVALITPTAPSASSSCSSASAAAAGGTPTPTMGVGVDLEQTHSRRRSVARRVLTEGELNELGKLKGVTADEEVLLRFSLKESVYKALHPLLNQYVGFQEAEVKPRSDGTAAVRLALKNGAHDRLGTITAHWRRVTVESEDGGDGDGGDEGGDGTGEDYFLSSASVRLRENGDDDVEIVEGEGI